MRDGKLGNVAQSDLRRVSRATVKATKAREELRRLIRPEKQNGDFAERYVVSTREPYFHVIDTHMGQEVGQRGT
jgi:hypothetical protein